MNKLFKVLSWGALIFILISAALCANGTISAVTNRILMFVGTVVWFVITPLWLGKKPKEEVEIEEFI